MSRKAFIYSGRIGAIVLLCSSLSIIFGCSSKDNSNTDSDSVAAADTIPFHADNDIVMLIRSMVDAIRVGEDLDSLRYTYDAVLTDGQGTPLYTDVQDSPGLWSVKIISVDNAIISNVYLGDLLPTHLRQYIVESLKLDSTAIVKDRPESELESALVVYDFDGGYIGFDTSITKAKDGREGTLMHIILSAEEESASNTPSKK